MRLMTFKVLGAFIQIAMSVEIRVNGAPRAVSRSAESIQAEAIRRELSPRPDVELKHTTRRNASKTGQTVMGDPARGVDADRTNDLPPARNKRVRQPERLPECLLGRPGHLALIHSRPRTEKIRLLVMSLLESSMQNACVYACRHSIGP
jgi:hypothetical protein